jgi:broad specificity phosphatase PhoE
VLARALEAVPLGAIYSSDLRRAYETAVILAEPKGLPVTPVPELREIDVGSWTGLAHAEVRERFPEAYTQMRTRRGRGWEDGESYAELVPRVIEAVRGIARAHPGDTVLVVTHSGPIRAVRAHALGADFATDRQAAPYMDRLELCAVTVDDGVFRPAEVDVARAS